MRFVHLPRKVEARDRAGRNKKKTKPSEEKEAIKF
jgi:hypothetical protein